MAIVVEASGSQTRAICSAGVYNAVCVNVFDLGMQPGYQNGPPKRKVVLLFELEKRMSDGPLKGQRYRLSKILSGYLFDKSPLTAILHAWIGYDAARDPKQKYDLDGLKGKPCTVTVVEDRRRDSPMAIVSSIGPKMESAEALVPETEGETPKFVLRMLEGRLDKPQPPAPPQAPKPTPPPPKPQDPESPVDGSDDLTF